MIGQSFARCCSAADDLIKIQSAVRRALEAFPARVPLIASRLASACLATAWSLVLLLMQIPMLPMRI